ncbi:MAG TPA: hypothetical protein VF264_02235 [Rhodanobacteraceae bacterium]
MSLAPSNSPRPTRYWRLFPAIPVIALGAFFLAGNLGYEFAFFRLSNWWAWFILLGACAPLTCAWEAYRKRGGFDASVAYYLLAATSVALVAVMFIARLDWSVWWPLFIILGGLYTLVPHRHRYCGADDAKGAAAKQ